MATSFVRGHEPLRVPQGWKDQDKALIIQLDRILDDIYRRFSNKDSEAIAALEERMDTVEGNIDSLDGRVDDLETAAGDLDGRLDTAEDNIAALQGAVGSVSGELTALYTLTVNQLLAKGSE